MPSKVLMTATLAFLAFCSLSPGQAPAEPSGEEVQVAVGETAKLKPSGLTICFESVLEDSRCPRDALCVRAGNGKVSLVVGLGYCRPAPLVLNTSEAPRSSKMYGYEITLVRLEPLRKMGETIDKGRYVVTLSVKKNG